MAYIQFLGILPVVTRYREALLSYIQFLGAAGTVTGSKHLINTPSMPTARTAFKSLIDCGMFQGQKEWRERNWQDLPIPAREIDAVILTHAHLDHCGWIPRLVKEGFRGPIYATPAHHRSVRHYPARLRTSCRKKTPRSTTRTRSRNIIPPCRSTRLRRGGERACNISRQCSSGKRSNSVRNFHSASCARHTSWAHRMAEITLTD